MVLTPITEREQDRYEVSKFKAAIEESRFHGRREVLSQATSRTLAGIETALRGRRNGTLQATKRHFAGVETALCWRRNVLSPAASENGGKEVRSTS